MLLWQDKRAARRILKATQDPEPGIRRKAASMIPKEAGKEGEQVLVRLLFDPEEFLRYEAQSTLEDWGREDVVKPFQEIADWRLLESDRELDRVDRRRLERCSTETLIGRLLENEQWSSRAQAAYWLGHKGGEVATDALIHALNNDAHFVVRRVAAKALGMLGGEDAIEALGAVEETEDGRVRVMAARSLVKLADPRGVGTLIAMLKDPDPRTAFEAAEALGEIGDERAVVPLLAAAQDARPVVRGFVAIALAPFGKGHHGSKVTSTLEELSKDTSAYVRVAATEALRRLGLSPPKT